MQNGKKKVILLVFIILTLILSSDLINSETQDKINITYISIDTLGRGYWSEIINISLPKYAIVSNASINIMGVAGDTSIITTLCYQETANVSNVLDGNCNLNYNGGYTFEGGYWWNKSYLYDGNFDTFGGVNFGYGGDIYVNYYKPDGALNSSLWRVKDAGGHVNLTIPNTCFNQNQSVLQLKITTEADIPPQVISYWCYDGIPDPITWTNLRSVSGGATNSIFEEAMWWNISHDFSENITLDIANDGDAQFNHTGIFNTTNTTSDFASEITPYLTTCTANATLSCNIPINISAYNGKIRLSALNITYTEVPSFSMVAPANNTNTTNKNIAVTYTYRDSNPNLCYWTNTSGVTNTTITCGTNLTNMNWKEGTTTVFIYVKDLDGNVNYSSVTFFVDSISPSIQVRYPTATYTTNNQINVNFTVSDANLDSCWWTNNTGINNYSLTCGNNVTGQLWKEGATTVIVSANDSLGHISSSSVTFTVDTTYPTLNLDQPLNQTYTTNSLNLKYTATDTNRDSCWYTLNSGSKIMLASCNNITFTASQGSTYLNLSVNDSAGNTIPRNVTFFVDSIKPNIRMVYPANNTYTQNNQIDVNYTVSDINLQACWWTNTSGVTNTTITCGTNLTNMRWKEGLTTLFIYSNDTFGNVNSTSVVLRVDTTAPSLSIVYPNNNTNSTNKYLNVNFTTSDSGIGLKNCWWTNDTGINNYSVACSGNITTGLWQEGSTVVYVYSNDSLGHINSSSVTFYIDSIAPVTTATGTSPPDGNSYSFNTWTNDSVKVTLNAVDSGIGFNNLAYPKYCVDTTNTCNPTTYISSGVTISTEGTSYIRYFSNDTLGNNEIIKNQTIKIDTTSPSYTIYYPTNYLNLSSNISINLNFSVTDVSSGINSIYFNINNGTNITLSASSNETFNTSDGDKALYFYVNDSLGHLNSTIIYFRVDTTNPNVTLLTPANNSYNSTGQNFTANLTDNLGWKNATLTIINSTNDIVNLTNFIADSSNALSTVIGSIANLLDGVYTWWISIRDWAGNSFTSINYTLTMDNTTPNIYFNSNTNEDKKNISISSIFINITVSDTNKDEVQFEFDGVNETFANNEGNYYWENKSGLAEGSYKFYAWIKDKAGNYNITETRNVTIDLTDPVVIIDSPVTGTYNYNVSINLNYSVSDINLRSCWWEIDNEANQSIACNTNTTFNISEGVHNVYFYANDSSGRIGRDTVSFSVSLLPPSISLNYPTNDRWINYKNNVQFNYTPSSTGTLDTCELWINQSNILKYNHSQVNPNDGVINSFYLNLTDGNHQWNVWCNDTTNNGGFALNQTFSIDSTSPLLSYSNDVLANDTNSTNTYIYVNITLTETNINTIVFTLFNNTGKVNQTTYTNGERNITWSNLIDNIYYYNVTINDSASNSNYTLTRVIRLDDTPPVISIVKPATQNYANNNSIALNYSVSDNFLGVKECWYYINNATATVITTRTLSTCQNTTFGLPSGDVDYTIYFFSKDLNDNTASASRTFGIRTNSPSIVLYPINNSFSNHILNNYFNFTVDTNADGIDTCELWGNFTGTWAKNQTDTSVSESTMIYFNPIGLTERTYSWNVWCNDTLNNSGWALRNITFTIDLTIPIVTINSISTTAGSQTISASFNVTDTYKDTSSCKYSIYNSAGNVNGLNNNVSITSCSSPFSATVTAYGTYNLTVVTKDLANNENQSTKSFTVSASTSSAPETGGTSETAIDKQLVYEKATNFSITTINGMEQLDLSLAKGSVRPRIKQFYVTNTGLEEITLRIECETSNKTTNGIDICDYVEIVNKTVTIAPNVQQKVMGEFYTSVPINASFDDKYYFNLVAKQTSNQSELYDKLSVSSKVSLFGIFNKWSYLPFQSDVKKDDKKDYPIWSVSLFLSFIVFGLVFFIFNSIKIPFTGFVIGSVLWISSFFMFMFIL